MTSRRKTIYLDKNKKNAKLKNKTTMKNNKKEETPTASSSTIESQPKNFDSLRTNKTYGNNDSNHEFAVIKDDFQNQEVATASNHSNAKPNTKENTLINKTENISNPPKRNLSARKSALKFVEFLPSSDDTSSQVSSESQNDIEELKNTEQISQNSEKKLATKSIDGNEIEAIPDPLLESKSNIEIKSNHQILKNRQNLSFKLLDINNNSKIDKGDQISKVEHVLLDKGDDLPKEQIEEIECPSMNPDRNTPKNSIIKEVESDETSESIDLFYGNYGSHERFSDESTGIELSIPTNNRKKLNLGDVNYKNQRKTINKWTSEEIEFLKEGKKNNLGLKEILDKYKFNDRRVNDLRDKWRGIMKQTSYYNTKKRAFVLLDENNNVVLDAVNRNKIYNEKYPYDAAVRIAKDLKMVIDQVFRVGSNDEKKDIYLYKVNDKTLEGPKIRSIKIERKQNKD